MEQERQGWYGGLYQATQENSTSNGEENTQISVWEKSKNTQKEDMGNEEVGELLLEISS